MVGNYAPYVPDDTRDDEWREAAAAGILAVARKQFAARGADGICLDVLERDSDSSLRVETWPYASESGPSGCPWW